MKSDHLHPTSQDRREGVSDPFKKHAELDPQTAKEIQIREQIQSLNDPEALKKRDDLARMQRDHLHQLQREQEQNFECKVREQVQLKLAAERNKPLRPALRPKYLGANHENENISAMTRQSEAEIRNQDKKHLYDKREEFIGQQQQILTEATARRAQQEMAPPQKTITIEFNSRGGHSR